MGLSWSGSDGRRLPAWLSTILPALLIIAVQMIIWPVPAGTFVSGVILGLLGSLLALGMALVWRANRIINFAQSDLGTVPATLCLLLLEAAKLPFLLVLPIGLASALLLGAIVELAIIRRFFDSPRLILTVATLGVSQLLVFAAALLPRAFGEIPANRTFTPPFGATFQIGVVIFDANDMMAIGVSLIMIAGLVWFLRSTDIGVAIRAAAERSDRANLLGIPVKRLQTVVWAIAALLSFVSVFFSAGVTSLAPGYAVSLLVLLRALAALVIGRMTNLATIATTSIALGVLDSAIRSNNGDANVVAPILVVIILVALLLQRRGASRVDREDASSWKAVAEVRTVPSDLVRLPVVRAAKWVGLAVLLFVAIGFPTVAGTGTSLKGGAILVFGMIGISMVILSGWAGQVSLGQMAFVGAGGAVAAWATVDRHLDPLIAILAAGVVGAVVAILVGLPALRLRGLYLAVTTLGLALAASSAVFNNAYWDWIPTGTFPRPSIFGRLSLDSATRVYYLGLVGLVLTILAARGIRRSRTGRVLLAVRDNEAAASSYGISVVRAKLTAFALSGFIAAVAGAIFVFQQASFRPDSYDAGQSINVFVATVVGGLGTITGGVVGAVYQRGAQWLLPPDWQLFASAIGVLLVLMLIPDGIAGVLYRIRDAWLRWLAERRGIAAPSLRGNADAAEELERAA
jgi:branched-chain amino acid transport system permease protein